MLRKFTMATKAYQRTWPKNMAMRTLLSLSMYSESVRGNAKLCMKVALNVFLPAAGCYKKSYNVKCCHQTNNGLIPQYCVRLSITVNERIAQFRGVCAPLDRVYFDIRDPQAQSNANKSIPSMYSSQNRRKRESTTVEF